MICYYCKTELTSEDLELNEEEPISVSLICSNSKCGNVWVFELEGTESDTPSDDLTGTP